MLLSLVGIHQARFVIVQIAFDETEQDVKVGGDVGIRHIMQIHMRVLIRKASDRVQHLEFAVPPCIVQSTDAATLATALHRRCDSLLKDRGIPVILILNADKASSCVSVACHETATFVGSGNMCLYGNCMMHMVFAALGGAVAPLKQIGPMFSATSLIHRANNMRILRKYVQRIVSEDLQV